jgi:hypothetical protein
MNNRTLVRKNNSRTKAQGHNNLLAFFMQEKLCLSAFVCKINSHKNGARA